ncbi:MAG: hypothetical protein GY778_15575 [bacterium]|nr:hypothetical protein [bacterium]
MSTDLTPARIHLRFTDKVLSLLAWAIAIGLFGSVGWMAVQPDDPAGAVSLMTRSQAWWSAVQVLFLAAVVAGLATVLVGRQLPDAGVFAVGLGLAALALGGDTTRHLLVTVTGGDAEARADMAWSLAGEVLVWFLAILVAMIVSGWVMRWYGGEVTEVRRSMSLAEMPGLNQLLPADDRPDASLAGLRTTVVCLAAAALLFGVLATGSPLRSVQHGQVYFALVAAFYIAGWIGYELFPAATPLWGCLAVPLLGVLGFVYCAVSSPSAGDYSRIASVPPSVFYRALPIEYVSVGTAAMLASFWSVRKAAAIRQAHAHPQA